MHVTLRESKHLKTFTRERQMLS